MESKGGKDEIKVRMEAGYKWDDSSHLLQDRW